MKKNANQPHVTHLYTYVIASADIYYTEEYQRTICICDDPKKGFQIWGEVPGESHITAVSLCEILLEYAMTCSALRDRSEAFQQIKTFGDSLGHQIAEYICDNTPIKESTHLAACGLECIIESMGVDFTVEQDGSELLFILNKCPVTEKAKRTGLRYEKLARYGLACLCRSLIHAINPELKVKTPVESDIKQVFSVKFPDYVNLM